MTQATLHDPRIGVVIPALDEEAALPQVLAAIPAVYLAYKWWRHRAENGIKV